ncbi:uncharacterized protein UTRI_00454_B [Ustilago trichophora]|uniref:Alpha-galactosidase n=1 Tax=Ustilago trichophora TaxID=86804 RepID=A0A5C3DR59_9BASI|nr:uncharacterized protein UTRI_00454_B [Ustilago trichophora]
MASFTQAAHHLPAVPTMRSAPIFQPALNSAQSIPQSWAREDGITFAAHYPADDYAASLASGDARLELWTNLPVSQCSAASTSRATAWKAVMLHPVKASISRKSGYSFVAKVKCSIDADDGVFGFTYRIVHPDGQIDWLGSPSNDGKIYLPSSNESRSTIRQLVRPHQGTDLDVRGRSSSADDHDDPVTLATLAASHRDASSRLSFSIQASNIQSGLVVERTKSTWCTSRRFQSLTDVSSEFGSNLLVLELAQSGHREVLVLLPVFDDGSVTSRLIRGSCNGGVVNFKMVGPDPISAKVIIALGTVDKLENTIAACRSHAARTLRAPIHEPLGLGWSAKKAIDLDSPLSPNIEAIVPSIPYSFNESECNDLSFYSDSTAVDSRIAGLSTASSMIFQSGDESHVQDEHDDASTINGERTLQAETRSMPSQLRVGLGFCTWEAMQNDKRRPFLSEVIAALEATEKRLGKGSITSLLIDDGWQDIVYGSGDRGRLNSFDMDPTVLDLEETLASGDAASSDSVLARYISHIRQRFPSIRSVGCWMTLAGYWDGIHPGGPIANGLSAPLRRVRVEDPFRQASRDWFIQATELDMHLFWDRAFHSLRQSGIDFVKIDAQAEWEWIQDVGTDDKSGHRTSRPSATLGKAAFEAMEGAAARYFGAGEGVIHSMAFTSALTNTSRTLHSQGMTVRCTDDFFPQIDEAHRHHLAHNVYNSLLLPEHFCDADMLSHCADGASLSPEKGKGLDYTGFHASFRAFTDARLWLSDKADAPAHDSIRALVPPPTLYGQGAGISVQARGQLLTNATFDDFIGDGMGPALKLHVQHESTGSATLGLWNLRANRAGSFDLLDLKQMIPERTEAIQKHDPLPTQYAVRSFRTGKVWVLPTEAGQKGWDDGVLSATLEAGSWEVLTMSPLLSTAVAGVRVALLGSSEHFMTPKGVHSFSILVSAPLKDNRRRRSASKSRRPSQQHRCRSTRSVSTSSIASTATETCSTHSTETALTTTTTSSLDSFVRESCSGSRVVLVSLAMINGFFALLHATVSGVVSTPSHACRKSKRTARVNMVDSIIGVLDTLQTLFVFGLLVLASWTSVLPHSHSSKRGCSKKTSWLPFLRTNQIQEEANADEICMDDAIHKSIRLRPADAVSTLKRCLASRTIVPLREFPTSIANPIQPASNTSNPTSPIIENPTPPQTPDVVATTHINMATKIHFLVLCPQIDCIKTCTIDRTTFDCATTPWITIHPIQIQPSAPSQNDNAEGRAFTVQVDMKIWVENQDETYRQSLCGPVGLSLRIISGSST